MSAAPKPPRPIDKRPSGHLRSSDLRGFARLATEATVGVTGITEGVHRSVLGTMGLAGSDPQRAGGLTGLIYRAVRGITHGVGWGVDAALAGIEPMLGDVENADQAESPQRVAVLAALNGVLGDRLLAHRSPFAITMSLRQRETGLALPPPSKIATPSKRILLMVHGLCRNDLQWRSDDAEGRSHNHGAAVADALGMSDIYLRYNSGRHVWQNGRDLADLLEQLLQDWPVPAEELCVLAHSMGGLVIRSAVHQALQDQQAWPKFLKQVVFLGTPHSGAPLERAGHGVDLILAASRWTAPFARLSGIRSVGITDLRHGRLLDGDLEPGNAAAGMPLPLADGIAWRAIAATLAERRGRLADRLVGDGLVPLNSALGRHDDARRCLAFAENSTWISPQTGHLALLNRPAVTERIIDWLGQPMPGATVSRRT